ncbi:hypothetical protein AVEN_151660-1 [Araneus ventricosus]|uniref:Reverse transcriptase/retrotransposon-derived protein RNase H-like domain-containing protein n=1 Tax=Araneus ventricosus TaxID=182803 RepID=A0A4Y2JW18_ARAVE|nr:hypothetical protein AVEN_151660-1 [Araneus ventricosus]
MSPYLMPIEFNLTEECEKSFDCLKQALTTLVLTYPPTEKYFIVDTDVSNEVIGVVLFQKFGNKEHAIDYFSNSFGKLERNCITCNELLASLKSLEHCRHYLLKTEISSQDHAPLRWPSNFKEPEGKIALRYIDLNRFPNPSSSNPDQETITTNLKQRK